VSKDRSQPDPDADQSLPQDHDRDERQPYAKEHEDYARGVAKPPEEQVGKDRKPRETPPGRQ
jgi:hypothetical protein